MHHEKLGDFTIPIVATNYNKDIFVLADNNDATLDKDAVNNGTVRGDKDAVNFNFNNELVGATSDVKLDFGAEAHLAYSDVNLNFR